jgi:hypothetical protein
MLRKSREEKSVAYMGTQNTVILRTWQIVKEPLFN